MAIQKRSHKNALCDLLGLPGPNHGFLRLLNSASKVNTKGTLRKALRQKSHRYLQIHELCASICWRAIC